MDAFELLKADHKKVAELFEQLETASGKRKLDVFKRIKSELEVHTHIEETILYPALVKPEETHHLTLEAYEEHKVIKTLLAELSAARSATDEWQAKAKVLRENVEHHVEEEENELFDQADDALTDEELATLGERMAAEKARKEGRPVPRKAEAEDEPAGAQPGIMSKIADFVGLGSSAAKKAGKKTAAKKKTGAWKRPDRKAVKSSRAVASTRSTATGSKPAAGSQSSHRAKKQGVKKNQKPTKKRAGSR